ncbi:hypothetical protein Y032_0058g2843 [Ancylostoma ceylanicum]|uniref:Uncharacterized protein n=1 Tax=Ancylostoma ceylanicum TaxID=53326 RepID=A0A016U3V7_9BILA|nr:hypothetical protein Y032_0058g2843 [Ancylostoma ceylanicum]
MKVSHYRHRREFVTGFCAFCCALSTNTFCARKLLDKALSRRSERMRIPTLCEWHCREHHNDPCYAHIPTRNDEDHRNDRFKDYREEDNLVELLFRCCSFWIAQLADYWQIIIRTTVSADHH